MSSENEIKINARGLSNPGPRLMVETALSKGRYETMRVVVTSAEAVEDLQAYFISMGARVEIDQIGSDYHILADFKKMSKGE